MQFPGVEREQGGRDAGIEEAKKRTTEGLQEPESLSGVTSHLRSSCGSSQSECAFREAAEPEVGSGRTTR